MKFAAHFAMSQSNDQGQSSRNSINALLFLQLTIFLCILLLFVFLSFSLSQPMHCWLRLFIFLLHFVCSDKLLLRFKQQKIEKIILQRKTSRSHWTSIHESWAIERQYRARAAADWTGNWSYSCSSPRCQPGRCCRAAAATPPLPATLATVINADILSPTAEWNTWQWCYRKLFKQPGISPMKKLCHVAVMKVQDVWFPLSMETLWRWLPSDTWL